MPIKIPEDLPARYELEREGLDVMGEKTAIKQDVRPLRIALMNLMPRKERTETQLARLIGATPLQIELTLLTTGSYIPKNVSHHHLSAFYRTFDDIKSEKFDGIIITGAPVEQLPFDQVEYWDELVQIMDWSRTNVHAGLFICWGAQAALHHFHAVPKHILPGKMFGVFPHHIVQENTEILRGMPDEVVIPVSRHAETRVEDVEKVPDLRVLMTSEESGLCMVENPTLNHIHVLNHLEYDATTLQDEYDRDVREGLPIDVPRYYFPDDDPTQPPPNRWRGHGHLFFHNWINHIYQTTQFDIDKIGVDVRNATE